VPVDVADLEVLEEPPPPPILHGHNIGPPRKPATTPPPIYRLWVSGFRKGDSDMPGKGRRLAFRRTQGKIPVRPESWLSTGAPSEREEADG
jgi:hypothetical protein